MKPFDVVALKEALPQEGLAVGEVGTIVDELPDGFVLVEFCDNRGQTLAMPALCLSQLVPYKAKELRIDKDLLLNGGARRDLSGVDLAGYDLTKVDLNRANLQGADLWGACLYLAQLSHANLSGANLKGADLKRADLVSANLSGANLSGADLRGAVLVDTNLSEVNLGEADLTEYRDYSSGAGRNSFRTIIFDTYLTGANLSGTSFTGAKVNNTMFESNKGISAEVRADLIDRGATFRDSPGSGNRADAPVPAGHRS